MSLTDNDEAAARDNRDFDNFDDNDSFDNVDDNVMMVLKMITMFCFRSPSQLLHPIFLQR